MTFRDPEGAFSLNLPASWTAEADPEAGGTVFYDPDGVGVLHLLSFPGDPDEFPDPAEELFAFLDEQGVELQEEEIEDLQLASDAEMAYTEYVAEADEGEDDEPTFHLVGVATAPGTLVFATYTCPAGEEEQERNAIMAALQSLRLADGAGPA